MDLPRNQKSNREKLNWSLNKFQDFSCKKKKRKKKNRHDLYKRLNYVYRLFKAFSIGNLTETETLKLKKKTKSKSELKNLQITENFSISQNCLNQNENLLLGGIGR